MSYYGYGYGSSYKYEYVEGCRPCSFVCYCCDIRYWRCMHGDPMYERKSDDSALCEGCYRGTNGNGLGTFCQWCYHNSHFKCICCKEEFYITDSPIRKRCNRKVSEKCCILTSENLEMLASRNDEKNEENEKNGERNRNNNFEHDHMCEDCMIATNEGTRSCKFCYPISYFVCSCCDREFFAENIRNNYREKENIEKEIEEERRNKRGRGKGNRGKGRAIRRGRKIENKEENKIGEGAFLYVCKIENNEDNEENEEVNEEQILCNDCGYGTEGGTRVCLYCFK